MESRRIAIACQGGGAQMAFTAGVLTAILKEYDKQEEYPSDKEKFEIVALSGTSGGAVCAALAWDELLTGAGTGSKASG